MGTLILVYSVAFSALIGVPLVIAPLAWARALGWRIPEPGDLAVYFGRCLGAVAVAIAANAAWTSGDPAAAARMLELLATAFAAMTLVHAWGWVRGIQPRFENLETFGYLALTVLTIVVRARG